MSDGRLQPSAQAPDSGRIDEFERLLAPVVGPAFGLAVRLAGNRQDAEDLVQEAALRAFRKLHTFTPGTNFRAWFFRILLNLAHSSNRSRRQLLSLDDFEEAHPLFLFERTAAGSTARADSDPARDLIDRIAADHVARALDELPEPFRQVAMLYFMDDLSYQQIADVLETPVGTVRSRIHRGRALLQQRLWHHARDLGLAGSSGITLESPAGAD